MGKKFRRGRHRKDAKQQQQAERSDHKVVEDGKNYVSTILLRGNIKMECYYALQGLHNHRLVDGKLIECENDEQKNEERQRWKSAMSVILPASFRIGKDVPEYFQNQLTIKFEQLLQEAKEYSYSTTEEENASKLAATETAIQKDADPAIDPENDPRRGPLHENATRMTKLSFLPHAYQLGIDRATLRKNQALQKLHLWLKDQVDAGYITRQETVSMVPPVLLGVQSTDAVLDMCAAPGSKTSQLLEDLSTVIPTTTDLETKNAAQVAGAQRGGVLVANDANAQRAYMLVHQLRRVLHNHPAALITACPAQFFPAGVTQFDKILCDVPCSGDGTSRKNIGVWRDWSASGGHALHALQLSIADKGAGNLLRVGGLMCYSTCSFNPIENEAVVAELLRRYDGALELVDLCAAGNGEPVPGFHTRPGMSTWKVLFEEETNRERKNKKKKNNAKMQARRKAFEESERAAVEHVDEDDGQRQGEQEVDLVQKLDTEDAVVDDITGKDLNQEMNVKRNFDPTSFDEATLLKMLEQEGLKHYESFDHVPKEMQGRIRKSSFPSTADEVKTFHLDRCIRCLPQDNDTGGFFVALLRKTAPISRADRSSHQQSLEASVLEDEDDSTKPQTKKLKVDSNENLMNDDKNENQPYLAENDNGDDEAEQIDAKKPVRGRGKRGAGKDVEYGKDDFVVVPDKIMDPLIDVYGLANGFEKDLYMTRANSDAKILYYVARPVKHLFDLGIQKRVTIINTGLKGFTRNSKRNSDNGGAEAEYRINQEGIHFLVPYMTRRKFVVGLEDFATCLQGHGKSIPLVQFSVSFQEQIKGLSCGSFAVVLEGYEDDKLNEKMVIAMWKCRGESVDGLVAKVEITGMLNKVRALMDQKDS